MSRNVHLDRSRCFDRYFSHQTCLSERLNSSSPALCFLCWIPTNIYSDLPAQSVWTDKDLSVVYVFLCL